jgi:hypothetical protein
MFKMRVTTRQLLSFFIITYAHLSHAAEPVATISHDNVICITIPKCGTHLLLKTLTLFGESGFYFNEKKHFGPPLKQLPLSQKKATRKPPHHNKGRYYHAQFKSLSHQNAKSMLASLAGRITNMNKRHKRLFTEHLPYFSDAESFIDRATKANFFMIRDPRAMLSSMAFMLKDGHYEGQHIDPQSLMWDFINGEKKHFIEWGVKTNHVYPLLWEKGVIQLYQLFMPWINSKKMLTIKFEDLVGSKGGGSDEVQAKTIYAIAAHLGITLSQEKFDYIKNNMFGSSPTFREGKIDGWKKHFTPEMKQAFKKVPGANQLLIELGYEKDSNW